MLHQCLNSHETRIGGPNKIIKTQEIVKLHMVYEYTKVRVSGHGHRKTKLLTGV